MRNCLLLSLIVFATQATQLSSFAQPTNQFTQTNLVANNASYSPQIVNPQMIDAWGIALRPPGAGGHIWVNDAVGGTSLEYIGDVNGQALTQDGLTSVTLHQPHFTDHGYAFATGIVYNAAKDLANQPVEFPFPTTTPPSRAKSSNPATARKRDSQRRTTARHPRQLSRTRPAPPPSSS
jgi:hypothetical protein